MTKTLEDVMNGLSENRREEIERRAKELRAEYQASCIPTEDRGNEAE